MIPNLGDVVVMKNADWWLPIEHLTSDSPAVPVDLTGATIEVDLAPSPGATPTLECTVGNGRVVVVSPTAGRWDLRVPMSSIPAVGAYAFDVRYTWPSGRKEVVMAGRAVVRNGVTT